MHTKANKFGKFTQEKLKHVLAIDLKGIEQNI